MIIYLNENKKSVLKTLLNKQQTIEEQKGNLKFFKGDLEQVFQMNYETLACTLRSLRDCRFIDIPKETETYVEFFIYPEMIEEQLQSNQHYVRRYKEWTDDTTNFFNSKATTQEDDGNEGS